MDKQPGTVDQYGELMALAADLGHDLATTQIAFLVNGDLPVAKTKELSHAIDLAAQIQRKMLALAKANLCRIASITEVPHASDVIIEQPTKETAVLAMVEMTIAQTHLLELFEARGGDDIMKHALEHLSAAITILAEVGRADAPKHN
jgi:hypothetical protein